MQPEIEASNKIPLAFCYHCEITVVTYRDLDDQQQLQAYCARCHGHLGSDSEVEEFAASASLLEALGYQVEEVRPKGGAGGCRTKGGSCGCSKSKKSPVSNKKGFQA
jgi:hypothetical protein